MTSSIQNVSFMLKTRVRAVWLGEILSRHAREIFIRCATIPYGAANLGVALGQMVQANRFHRPTRVFLDGDQGEAVGCILLPGADAPERVVFGALQRENYRNLWTRIGRDISTVTDACNSAMTLTDHHDWMPQLYGKSTYVWRRCPLEFNVRRMGGNHSEARS